MIHAPAWFREAVHDAADDELEAGVEAAEAGDRGALGRLGRRIRWTIVAQGLVVAALGGALAYWMNTTGGLGGGSTALYLLPWLAILGGLWRSAAGLLSR